MKIQLYNTLSKSIESFSPLNEQVGMYSCGPTVYNYVHIGNLRSFLFADTMQRVLKTVGNYDVRWVMNITDIDDKTIRDSAIGSPTWNPLIGEQTNDVHKNLSMLTEFYTSEFLRDIADIGIDTTQIHSMPRATKFIPQMQELITKIYENGFAYIADGSVYFNVEKWQDHAHYGQLFTIDKTEFKKGVRIDADEYEREHVSDFVLWKAKKDNEPSWEYHLDGQILDGRPGWHIECSAMEYELLGLPFDIHTGGLDLRFPHHEDEIAQSKAGYGIDPTVFWCHNEFLLVEGKKMSKSLGNFFTLRDLVQKGYDPNDVRFYMISAHYRSLFNFTFEALDASVKGRIRIQEFIDTLLETTSFKENATIEDINELETKMMVAFANDLHVPKALSTLFIFINNFDFLSLTLQRQQLLLQLFSKLNAIFSVFRLEKLEKPVDEIPEEIKELAAQRDKAKRNKDYALADSLRATILERGYTINDASDGYILVKNGK
ncbi:MAG: cysteine--tRNA ligase [Candidatus Kapabacteria bacterium]|nr:cysteine--tRNA ligase [Candidatus Kapabacteria bacterium]